jgi:hypothetical protein
LADRLEGAEFTRAQDDEVKQYHTEYLRLANEFLELWEHSRDKAKQQKALRRMYSAGTAYYRCVETAIFNRDSLRGDDYEAWKRSWTTSAKRILNGLARYHENLRHYRQNLGLRDRMFEPAAGAYECLQQFFAETCPQEAAALKRTFAENNLPTGGFDKPYIPGPAPESMRPPFWLFALMVIIFGCLALACIGGGIYALYKSSLAETTFDFLGFHLKTGHAGVAFVGIGLATAYFTVRAILKKV